MKALLVLRKRGLPDKWVLNLVHSSQYGKNPCNRLMFRCKHYEPSRKVK